MAKYRFWAILIIFASIVMGLWIWNGEKTGENKFKLGLDLSGGTQLIYRADTSKVASGEIDDSMEALRNAIERRVNLFGVSEPLVQVETSGIGGEGQNRLIVELPGVTNVQEAIDQIGKTPTLEFMLMKPDFDLSSVGDGVVPEDVFIATGLDGGKLQKATIQFDPNFPTQPIIGLQFNTEGKNLFAEITKNNIGRIMGIFLDGLLIQAPYIREEIPSGEAVITGDFTAEEAKQVVRDLNYGALPVPVELISTQSIGATLGQQAVADSLKAGLYSFIIIAIFLIGWYRGPGLVSVVALIIYTVINLALFKLMSVTLTAAGIAGFILSIGMAVDANILIFERTKEEFKKGKNKVDALSEGFKRAWTSIRDSNLSSIITALILFYLASTPVVKGFALVFLIGVLVSMFSAITASRTILFAMQSDKK
ncbi:MAG TPA: protein translocase subunit SecD [Candidatus Paceibacterota bacterium]